MIRILVIEDDVTICRNTAELLELEGFSVSTASDGKIGLDKIKSELPDLILCDLRMPEMDGFTVLSHVGQNPELKRIPFIFFSAKSEKVDIRAGFKAGADDYVVKPFEFEELLSAIEKCLHKKQLP